VHFADDLFGKQTGLARNTDQNIRLHIAHHIQQQPQDRGTDRHQRQLHANKHAKFRVAPVNPKTAPAQ
jgi:hypothetical protein